MKWARWLLLFTLAASVPALSQGGAAATGMGTTGRLERSRIKNAVQYTTAQTAWYVDASTGSDGNDCLTPGTACLTGQGALDKIPKYLKHRQAIYFATGSYPCMKVSGFLTDPNATIGSVGPITTAGGAGIALIGTLSNSTLTTGTAGGTITSSSTGQTSVGVSFTVVTDNTQSWTTDNLKGRFVTFGNFTRQVITSNTATTFTILTSSAAPANGVAYVIQDAATFINSLCTIGPTVGGAGVDGGFNGSSNGAALVFQDLGGGSTQQAYYVEQIAFSNTLGSDVSLNTPTAVVLQDVQLQNTSSVSVRVSITGGVTNFTCNRCAFRRTALENTDHISSSSVTGGLVQLSSSLFESGRSIIAAGDHRLNLSVVMMNPLDVSFGVQARGSNTSLSQVRIENSSSGGTAVRWGDTDNTTYAKGELRLSSCTFIGAIGIDCFGNGFLRSTAGNYVSDAGLGQMRAGHGCGMQFGTGDVITNGIDTNNVVLFGNLFNNSTQNTFGISTVRNASPACVTDTFGDYFCSP